MTVQNNSNIPYTINVNDCFEELIPHLISTVPVPIARKSYIVTDLPLYSTAGLYTLPATLIEELGGFDPSHITSIQSISPDLQPATITQTQTPSTLIYTNDPTYEPPLSCYIPLQPQNTS